MRLEPNTFTFPPTWLQVWDVETHTQHGRDLLVDEFVGAVDADLTTDGNTVALASMSEVELWDTVSGAKIKSLPVDLNDFEKVGIVQNMTAPNAPAALKGQVVSVAFSDYYHHSAYQGGVWRKELLEGWLQATNMKDVNLPTFLEHGTYDEFWKELSAEAHAEQVDAPGLYVGGWYDIFVQGTINSFVTIQERGGPQARGKCILVIAPTAHGAFNEAVVYPDVTQAPINIVAPMNLYAHWLKEPQADVEQLQRGTTT